MKASVDAEAFVSRAKHIEERDFPLLGHRPHRIRVELHVLVLLLAVGKKRVIGILDSDRRNQHEARLRLGVVARVAGRVFVDELLVVRLELLDAVLAGERFVEAEEAEERIRVEGIQGVVDFRVIAGALMDGDLFRGASEVADHEFLLRESQVEQRLEVAVEAHALAGAVADDGDAFALDEFERQLARGQVGLLRTRAGLQDLVHLLLRVDRGGCEGREQGGKYEEAEGHARGSGGCLALKVARRGGKVNGGLGQ